MCGIKGKLENPKEFQKYFAFSLEKSIKPRHREDGVRFRIAIAVDAQNNY